MTTNQVLIGIGLILVLAVGSQVLASRPEAPRLTRYEVGRRYAAGARIRSGAPADGSLLFLVRADGRLAPVTMSGPPQPEPGDTMVLLCPAAGGP